MRDSNRRGGRVRRWWRQPDQFEWLSGYLHARGLATQTQRFMALVCAALVGMPLGLLRTSDQQTVVTAAILIAAALVGVTYAVLWLRHWPSRAQSMTMIACGGLVAVCTILAAEPVVALISCNGLVVLCAYLAFFHSVRSTLISVVCAVLTGAVSALRVAEALPGSPVAMTGFWVVVEVCVTVPVAIIAVVRTLGRDVVRADHDSLTGVLNRRAFYERAAALLTTSDDTRVLVVAMIDLDHFKLLNDTYGHIAGDQALTAVGWALRQAGAGTAVIGRAGGEEFVVADRCAAQEAEALPDRLRAAIAALPHPVTASVGAAIVPLTVAVDPAASLTELVRIADAAMYQAKRGGGDRVVAQMPGSPRR